MRQADRRARQVRVAALGRRRFPVLRCEATGESGQTIRRFPLVLMIYFHRHPEDAADKRSSVQVEAVEVNLISTMLPNVRPLHCAPCRCSHQVRCIDERRDVRACHSSLVARLDLGRPERIRERSGCRKWWWTEHGRTACIGRAIWRARLCGASCEPRPALVVAQ